MFTKKTLYASIVTGIIAFIISFSLTGCGLSNDTTDHDTSKPLMEQVHDAGLPSVPMTQEEFDDAGRQACSLRAEGTPHEEILYFMSTGKVAPFLTEDERVILLDIIYANYCAGFRVEA